MSIEKTGEFTRENELPENVSGQEKSPNDQLFEIYSGIQIQNTHPSFSEKPEDTFYWKGDRLEAVKQGLATIEDLSVQNQISEVVSPFNSEERVNVQPFIDKVKRSIEYSEQINEQLKTQPEVSDEEKARRKAEIRKRLLGE
ncbi:MAG: hypothetical protein ABL917_02805 [Parcubacteria group bacterium]